MENEEQNTIEAIEIDIQDISELRNYEEEEGGKENV